MTDWIADGESGSSVRAKLNANAASLRIALTSNQLLHLTSSPVEVIPAQGAGKLIVVTEVICNLTFATAAYVSPASSEGLYYANDLAANGPGQTAFAIAANGISAALLASANRIGIETALKNLTLFPGNGSTGPAITPVNQAVVLGGVLFDMTTGDGTATITVYYVVVTL